MRQFPQLNCRRRHWSATCPTAGCAMHAGETIGSATLARSRMCRIYHRATAVAVALDLPCSPRTRKLSQGRTLPRGRLDPSLALCPIFSWNDNTAPIQNIRFCRFNRLATNKIAQCCSRQRRRHLQQRTFRLANPDTKDGGRSGLRHLGNLSKGYPGGLRLGGLRRWRLVLQ